MIFLPSECEMTIYAKASATENAGIGESSSETRVSITAGTKKTSCFLWTNTPWMYLEHPVGYHKKTKRLQSEKTFGEHFRIKLVGAFNPSE